MTPSRQRENKNSCNSTDRLLMDQRTQTILQSYSRLLLLKQPGNLTVKDQHVPGSLCARGLSPPLDDISATINSESHKVFYWVAGSGLPSCMQPWCP